jgi:tetratricopeptide (TPR) repeat protein
MGKSALAWYWLHGDVLGTPPAGYSEENPENLRVPEDQRPEGVLFWSFYEQDAHFGAFLDRAARYVGASDDSTADVSDREKLDIVLGALGQHRILLILDGFERELRAYAGYRAPYQGDVEGGGDGNDCVDPRAAEFLQSAASLTLAGRVLLTSRLFPNELINLAGCRHEQLDNLAPDDVVSFFEATGVKGTRAEIAQAVAPYGGHPLSVSLLARAIVKDRRMKGDIKASGRHTVLDKLKGKHGHDILAVAYDEMSDERRELLSRIAAFRSPMDYEALREVAGPIGLVGTLLRRSLWSDAALDELEARGLLLRDPDSGRYDLHPIVRQYAYDRLADKAGVHGCLREYFGARPAPDRVETLADLAPTIELYWHTVGAHHFSALKLFRDRLVYPLYHRFGAYEQVIELMGALFPEGEEKLPQLSSQDAQAWTLSILANSYSLSGQPRRAALLFEMHNGLQDKLGYKLANMLGIELGIKRDLAIGLENLANEQIRLGQLETAGNALRRSIELCREISNELWEAVGHQESGRLFAYEGRFSEVQRELETALKSFHSQSRGQSECIVWASRAVLGLLRGDPKAALAAARESRRLADVKSGEADII